MFKVGFYKSFGRPIAKVFLGAIFTYQVTYLMWTKLESDEIKQQKRSMFIYSRPLAFLRTVTDVPRQTRYLSWRLRLNSLLDNMTVIVRH